MLQVTQSVEAMVLSGGSQAEVGTKLYLSNLDYGVSNEDIKVLGCLYFYKVKLFFGLVKENDMYV